MNAQKRGIQKAIEKVNNDNIKRYGLVPFNLQDIPEPCRGILHKRTGVCPKCKIRFVKWRCYDEDNSFLYETYQPYGKYLSDENSPRKIELLNDLDIIE